MGGGRNPAERAYGMDKEPYTRTRTSWHRHLAPGRHRQARHWLASPLARLLYISLGRPLSPPPSSRSLRHAFHLHYPGRYPVVSVPERAAR